MNNEQTHGGSALKFRNWSMAKKLAAGFSAIIICIITLVLIITSQLRSQSQLQSQVMNEHIPTDIAVHGLINGVNASLAALRGYMLLNQPKFKTERKQAWDEINHHLDILNKLSKHWTNQEDIARLNQIKSLKAEFNQAQTTVEAIANTDEEQPALKILLTEAAPQANTILKNITSLINLEKAQPATAERKALLSNLADSRGSFALSLAAIRAYLLSGDSQWIDSFEKNWRTNATALQKLSDQSHLFSGKQRQQFENYQYGIASFTPLPKRMFDIRSSNQWNQANFLLGTEAAPRAEKIMQALLLLLKSQDKLVKHDAVLMENNISMINSTAVITTIVALALAVLIAMYLTQIITKSFRQAISLATAISSGNLDNEIIIDSSDESGQLLSTISEMQHQLRDRAEKSLDFTSQIEAISKAQAIIEFNMDGSIITANDNFLSVMGYSLDELLGQHHKQFVEPELAGSAEYREFWAQLNRGEYQAGEFKRFSNDGKEIWIQASYNPILDLDGNPVKVVKFATDITAQKLAAAENQKIADISSALKLCDANVMLADNDLNIVYMNDGIEKMFKGNEDELQQNLPAFNVNTLIGTCVDVFHTEPSHQRHLLSQLDKTSSSQITIGKLTFRLTLSPWKNVQGTTLGTVVEWYDLTQELAQQKQERAVAAANARIKIALDRCKANVMMADNDLNIIYTNESVCEMMQRNEVALRSALPNFSAAKLIGTCVDDFHANPAHQRTMIAQLESSYNTKLKLGGLTFDLVATPIFDEDNTRLGTVVEWQDLTASLAAQLEESRIADENSRIKQALDNVSTNTMIANADNEIIYLNEAVDAMMLNAEYDIQQALPNFNAKKLMGECMDVFHKNPAHQKGMIERLESSYSTQISVGTRTFGLIANPIRSAEGERIGTVVEWEDRTEEVAIEKEIADLISAAGDGDLSNRIGEDGKSGFFLNLAGGLNQLIGIAEGVIDETATMLDAMAHGDLTKRITSDYKGAFDKLKSDANGTAEKLTEVITRVNNSSSAVASGAEEIAQGNTDLSQRTEEQASSLEETASSMEQMTSTVRQNADNAKVANDLAADATVKAQKGGDVVKRAVNSMSEINDSSKKIADIIGVIDEIAFQTNLLALNAAVEAARAGEQGRGFAVVAGEVRNLAQRSAAAAKEIKDLIRDSVSKVQDGSQLVNESGATLSEIVDAISRVTAMIGDISNASSEQSEGIEQVNKAVTQMDEMTQQNAALVEEASAAGETMADQARSMRQILGFFTTGGDAGSMTAKSPMLMSPPAPAARPATKDPVATPAAAPTELTGSMDFADDDEEWEEF